MVDHATSWPGFRWCRSAFVVIGIVMSAFYFYDASTTSVVAPNVIKGSLWIILVLLTVALDVRLRRRSRTSSGERWSHD